jgi:GT2 family glycosyltransferase
MKNVDISFVIVAYKSDEDVIGCIASIIYNHLGEENFEIIIVDNYQGINNLQRLLAFTFPSCNMIRYFKSSCNGGYGWGNNFGSQFSNGKILIFCNPDIRLVVPITKKVTEEFRNDPKIGAVSVKFLDGSNNLYPNPEIMGGTHVFFRRILILLARLGVFNKIWPSGSFFIVRKSSFEQAGKFDENIFMYHEEVDLMERLRRSNYQLRIMSGVSVFHKTMHRKINKRLVVIGNQSRRYYFKKYNHNLKIYSIVMIFSYALVSLRNMVFAPKSFGQSFFWLRVFIREFSIKERFNE